MPAFLKLMTYLASFGIARGGLFLAPILLANLLAPSDYGMLELSQAIGSVGASVFALGTAAAVPLVLVRKIAEVSWRSILLHAPHRTRGTAAQFPFPVVQQCEIRRISIRPFAAVVMD